MPVIYCNIDPFVMKQSVLEMSNNGAEVIFSGNMTEIAVFMAQAYSTKKYDRIVLQGSQTEKIVEDIRFYGLTNYNLNNIEIEVI